MAKKMTQTDRKRRFRREKGDAHHSQIRERFIIYRANRSGRPRRQIPRAAAPSSLTLMNLFCGFVAIIQTHEGNFSTACWLIVMAGLFDLFDGMVARMAKATSSFGVELDSLADVVSFGAAPAFLVYEFGLKDLNIIGLIVAALPVLGGAVRLARFNVYASDEKSLFFDGLPIPAQAFGVVSFILAFLEVDLAQFFEFGRLSVLVPLVVILSVLMVSTVKFVSLPKPSVASFKAHPWLWVGYAFCFVLVLFLQGLGLFLSLVLYLCANIIRAVVVLVRALWQETDPSQKATAS